MSEEEKFKEYLKILNEENSTYKKEKAIQGLLDLYNKTKNQLEEKTYLYNKLETESKYLIEKQQKEIKNCISKDKIIEMIKELEFEIKHAELDKCSQYYDYFNYRKFAINKLKELLEE